MARLTFLWCSLLFFSQILRQSLSLSFCRRTIAIILSVGGFLCLAGLAKAQVSPGTPSWSAYDQHQVDTVNLMSNTIMLNLPVMSKSGAFPFSAGLQGNNYAAPVGGTWNGGTGWGTMTLSFIPILEGNFSSFTSALCPDGVTPTYEYGGWYVLGANQTYHWLPAGDFTDTVGCWHSTLTDQTIDGSGYTLSANSSGVVTSLLDRGGNLLHNGGFTWFTDTNGNTLTETTSGGNLIDSLGTTVLTLTATGAQWTDVSGGSPAVSQTTSSLNMMTNFGCSGIAEANYSGVSYLTVISSPYRSSIGLTYEGTPGHSGYYTPRLNVITLPEGGTITYSYLGSNHGMNCTYGTVPELKRVTSDGTTTYTLAYSLERVSKIGSASREVLTCEAGYGLSFCHEGSTEAVER